MMNVVAVFLVMSSLVTAGFWSPKPDHENANIKGENVIVKEGHRVVVVEYDPDSDGNTKVLISPQDHTHPSNQAKETLSSVTDNAKEKAKETFDEAKEAASVLPNLGQGISGPNEPNSRGPRELVCDAFGKCKHKIASAMGKAKDKASEAAHDMTEKAQNVEEQAKDKVSEAIEKTKDTISRKTDEISSRAHEAKERAGEAVKETVDTAKTMKHDVAKNLSSKIGKARERGERELGEIFLRVKHVWGYVMGIVHLLGFATAYGMCIWVTFISSYVLAGALPRQQFGIVQSKVYPVYFRMLAYCVVVTLVGHLYEQRKNLFSKSVGMAHACSLLCSLAMILFNLLYLEPRATKAMFVRMKLEKEEGRGHDNLGSEPTARITDHHISATSTPPQSRTQEENENTDAETKSQIMKLGEKLKKLNAYSSFLNILTLMALTSHLVYLGQRLRVNC